MTSRNRRGGGDRRRRRAKPNRRLPVEVLSGDEVMRLLGAVKGPPATAARNRAIIALAYRSGLRISEVLAVCPKAVDAANGSIRVLNGKGGRSRTVGVDPGAALLRATAAIAGLEISTGDHGRAVARLKSLISQVQSRGSAVRIPPSAVANPLSGLATTKMHIAKTSDEFRSIKVHQSGSARCPSTPSRDVHDPARWRAANAYSDDRELRPLERGRIIARS